MDAIRLFYMESFSPSFLNKAADDAKNRRSVLKLSVVSRKMVLQTVETQISARSLRWRSRTRERTSPMWALRLK